MKLYDKAVGRLPKPPEEEEPPAEVAPSIKEQWAAEDGTQQFINHLAYKRQNNLEQVANYAYHNGTIGHKQISQLIEAESIKLAIQEYLEKREKLKTEQPTQ